AGKVALVTGAAAGIGAATADLLVERGARVIRADLRPGSGADWQALDVAEESAWQAVLAAVARAHGGIDILVNAAGVSLDGDVVDTCTEEIWRRTMAVNLDGTFLGCKHVIPLLRARGGGAIVNFGSVLAQVGDGRSAAYVASKGGVRMLTHSTALYCAKFAPNVRCNLVCPGYIETRMSQDWLDAAGPAQRREIESAHPMQRLGQPREVAQLVAYLASDEAATVTGAEFAVDGGYLAR
ncbi:MAG: SDR family oxidoreductase, partial [Rhodospirillaceae bacterium]|nr:SDR family oxidoreductase [Rhodospirillaceae bacterium]